jgi:carbon monoxide dehydrogenase subunit G
MELHGERLIPADVETTWAALNDPEVLKACITGCESLERTGDNAFTARVAVKVGPVSARFTGNLQLQNVQPPTSYTIVFDGQGGVAGFGRGSADVNLSAEGTAQTKLAYEAKAQVGGKLAQIGSRLVDAAAAKIAEDFFRAFEARLQPAVAPAAGDTASGVELPSGMTDEVPSAAWAVSGTPAASAAPAAGTVPLAPSAPAEAAPMGTTAATSWGWWLVAIVIVVAVLYFLVR